MERAVQYAVWVVFVHALVSALHGAAHLRLNVPLSLSQNIYIVVVIGILPVVAGLLLLKRRHLSGTLLFLGSMAGAFVFGVYNHFAVSSPDHVSQVAVIASGKWVSVFQVTAVLLALVEAFGCLVAGWMVKLYLGISRLKDG